MDIKYVIYTQFYDFFFGSYFLFTVSGNPQGLLSPLGKGVYLIGIGVIVFSIEKVYFLFYESCISSTY